MLGLLFFATVATVFSVENGSGAEFLSNSSISSFPSVIRIDCDAANSETSPFADVLQNFEGLHWHPRVSEDNFCELQTEITPERLAILRSRLPTLSIREQVNEDALAFLHWKSQQQNAKKRYSLASDQDGGYSDPAEAPNAYHDIGRLGRFMDAVAKECKEIARVSVIGKSRDGHPLYVVRLTHQPDEEVPGKPEVKYVGNMHGDETVGRECLINFIRLVCHSYRKDPEIGEMVEKLDMYIVPTMNPDGFERHRRENGGGVDLNRNFPDQYSFSDFDVRSPPYSSDVLARREPETLAVMTWSMSRNFVLSANLHGGSIVANYPWDGNRQHRSGQYAATPDDDIFRHLATTYAKNNPDMLKSREFRGGITNGAQWYVLYGGMQDFNYLWTGNMELTLELSYRKFPDADDLPSYWEANKKSLIELFKCAINMGVRGRVVDKSTGEPLAAVVDVKGLAPGAGGGRKRVAVTPNYEGHWVHTDKETGDYFRLLTKGSFEFTVSAIGYKSLSKTVDTKAPGDGQVALNFELERASDE